jgi:CDP-glycerol glycerophosphotransferase (TagB/SpsB family)
MISTAVRLARVSNAGELAAAVLLVVAFPVMLVAAVLPSLWTFVVAAAAAYAIDWWLTGRKVRFIKLLSRFNAGASLRVVAREVLVLLLLARLGFSDTAVLYVGFACWALLLGLQLPHRVLTTALRRWRELPVVTRNIDLSALHIPATPPAVLTRRGAEKMLSLDVFAVAGLVVTALTADTAFGVAGCAATVVLGVGYLLLLFPHAWAARRLRDGEKVLEAVDAWLADYRPTTVLYFSGSRTSAYQVGMWLETMAEIEGRPLVVLRERFIVPQLATTGVPVLCVPSAVHLMNMDLSSVRVALYPANVGKNIHMLREPGIQHVFIGHGDSDKIASVNPYCKVYDEVWTAGRAGRDRFALAAVGVRDEAIVEVGRPQLAPIRRTAGGPAQGMLTVLYAPTWEGWTDDPGNTSLTLAGVNIIRELLAAEPQVRVIYKPHPFTGMRCSKAKAAHQRILALLEQANAERAAAGSQGTQDPAEAARQQEARQRLARLTAQLAEVEADASEDADEASASRDGITGPEVPAEAARLRQEWNEAYWRAAPEWEHRVVVGPRPHLYDCFNAADLMVSDISSVVSDFVASGKPYAIANTSGVTDEEFRRQNTTVRAATILTPDARQLAPLLAAVRENGDEESAADRARLKEYLLGADEPDSMTRVNAAVRRLTATADARLARLGTAEGEHSPDPDDMPPSAADQETDEDADRTAERTDDRLAEQHAG